jgi:hypothetical protein
LQEAEVLAFTAEEEAAALELAHRHFHQETLYLLLLAQVEVLTEVTVQQVVLLLARV